MVEMPILCAENQAVNPGSKQVTAKNLVSEKVNSKGDFSKRLQKIKQKTHEGGDEPNNIDKGIEVKEEKRSAASISAIPTDYFKPTLAAPLEISMESDSSISDATLISALEASLGSELLTNTDQTLSAEMPLEPEEVTSGVMEYSTEPIQLDNELGEAQSASGGEQLSGQLISPVMSTELIQSAAVIPEVNANLQKVELMESVDIQQEEAENSEKSIGLKNIANYHKMGTAQSGRETGDDRSKTAAEASDTTVRNDQSDVKKLIDFESHRMKASKLPAAVEADNQEAGTNSEAMNDKTTMIEIKQAKTEVNFQDQLRTPASTKEVIEQIVDKVEIIQSKKLSELTLDLKPDSLGKMTIKLVMEEGGLTARFVTDNLHVKHLLESNLNTLKQTLENQGIKVEKTEVNVQLNNGGMFDGSEGNQQDRWQNQEYVSQTWSYVEEIPLEDDQSGNSEDSLLNYADREIIDEIGMNFLV